MSSAASPAYARSARSGYSTSSPWGVLDAKEFNQPACDAQLQQKTAALIDKLPAGTSVDVRASPAWHHRHRAQFAVRRVEAGWLELCQFDSSARAHIVAEPARLPILSRPILFALAVIVNHCKGISEEGGGGDSVSPLWSRLSAVHFHSSNSPGDLCVTLVYERSWDKHCKLQQKGGGKTVAPPPPDAPGWLAEAGALQEELAGSAQEDEEGRVSIVGRWRGHRLVVGQPLVREWFSLAFQCGSKTRILRYQQPEGQFSNPNALVAGATLQWLADTVSAPESGMGGAASDLLELHSGFGANTLAVSECFRKVVSVEISRELAEAQEINLQENGIKNVTVLRMDAAVVCAALISGKNKAGGGNGGGDGSTVTAVSEDGQAALRALDGFDIGTVIVDPPRGGLDSETLTAIASVQNILGIWCNAEAMVQNLKHLSETHKLMRVVVLDQFPFTNFLECACHLERARGFDE